MTRKIAIIFIFVSISFFFCNIAIAQSASENGEPSSADAAAQANNPLANMKAFNLHNYYIGELTESDENANQFWMRYAQPLSISETDWLMRASLPINTYPTPPDASHETGLGDFNIFAAYLFDMPDPALSVGLGPQITAPTATEDALGSEKWSAGFAQITFDARNPKYQYGYLLTWQASFAGEDDPTTSMWGPFSPSSSTNLEAAPIFGPPRYGCTTLKTTDTASHSAWGLGRC